MVAREVRSMMVACLCGLACVLGVCALPGVAGAAEPGATQIGSTEIFGHEGEGAAAGQLVDPVGVAVNNDSSSLSFGNLYVGELSNYRVDRFAASSGAFQLAWGSGVVNGASELQTCTTSCQRGRIEQAPPYVTGGVVSGTGVAVDSDPLSSSAGDVYVLETAINRVEKFGPSGEFLLTFGGDVNETTGGNVCLVGEKCKAGTEGSASGQFGQLGQTPIAVGSTGLVYVGDVGRVQVFEPSGVWKETISLAALSSTGVVTGLAVDSSGDVFVKDAGAAGVREFEPGGVEKSVQFDAGSTSVASIAVDGAGDLYVGDTNGRSNFGFHVLKYNPAGKAVGDFGANTVRGGSTSIEFKERLQNELFDFNGMAFSEASGSPDLYVSERYEERSEHNVSTISSSVWMLPVPPPGPFIAGESATPGPRESSRLEATVDAEGSETAYHFEYVSDANFKVSGYADAVSTPVGSLGASLAEVPVSVVVTGLSPTSLYHYRVVASNAESSKGPGAGPDQVFETLPAVLLENEYATNVTSSSATLNANVNPLGAGTEYRFEYGTSASHGSVVTGNAGAGSASELISAHLQGLMEGGTYHYRITVSNEFGTVVGSDRAFTTQIAGGELALPDGRAWDLVSPQNKKGALIEPFTVANTVQAAADGSAITYLAAGPHLGEDPAGKATWSQVLSRRGAGGWRSEDLTLPGRLPENEVALNAAFDVPEYMAFSPDLSLAAVEPQRWGTPLLSPEATERTLYLRSNANGIFRPLVTPANTPPETQIDGHNGKEKLSFLAATPDLGHILLDSPFPLTSDAPTSRDYNLYEWGAGQLQLVNILPNGKPTQFSGGLEPNLAGEYLDEDLAGFGSAGRAISNDGRWIAWTWGSPYYAGIKEYAGLYVRDMVEGRTVQVGGPGAAFQVMSSDGSRVLYLEGGDLHEFDTATGLQLDLTLVHGPGENNAGVMELVSDVSEDSSHIYFVATGVLASGGVSGQDNLYLLQDRGSGWSTSYIASLSQEDEKSWNSRAFAGTPRPSAISSRVSPDGRYLAFMSSRPLTGYDNRDALSGQPDQEVYLYDALAGHLACASCNPSGARPVGVFDNIVGSSEAESLLVDRSGVWGGVGYGKEESAHWLAGSLPGWDVKYGGKASYQPRYLSDSGRLFFNSPDALVPQDTNGLEDVYQYEPVGVGGCVTSGLTFSERSGGCVNLITSGISSRESAFYDASENGDDAFFVTAARLTSADYDSGLDVYDAHVCSAGAPCVPDPVSSPPCTSGDSCKAAPSPQPELFGPTPSATFSGIGNVSEEAKSSLVKHKTKAGHKRKKRRKGKKGGRAKVKARGSTKRRVHGKGGGR